VSIGSVVGWRNEVAPEDVLFLLPDPAPSHHPQGVELLSREGVSSPEVEETAMNPSCPNCHAPAGDYNYLRRQYYCKNHTAPCYGIRFVAATKGKRIFPEDLIKLAKVQQPHLLSSGGGTPPAEER